MSHKPLILASASPRRRELLSAIGLPFTINVTDVDETHVVGESPHDYVLRLARAKAQAGLVNDEAGSASIGADTIVVIDNEILGKPRGPIEGEAMLRRLSGRAHVVYTGVAVCDGERLESCVVSTTVHFRPISAEEVHYYWLTGEGADKAGSYGIQEIGSIFASRIDGSYSAVVGLPLAETEALLQQLNIDTWSVRIDGRRTPN